MPLLIFSNHAQAQLKERRLSEEMVIEAVEIPDKIVAQKANRYRIAKSIQKNGKKFLLIVVYDRTDERIEIVTAFLTTKFKKYL